MPKVVTITEKLDVLPLHSVLSWERFQLFCTDVLYKRNRAVDSREYLLQGSTQEGIDIYVVNRGGVKMTVAQCKLRKYIGPQSIIDMVDEFLKGTFVATTGEFIICTTADLTTEKDEQAIALVRQKLNDLGIALRVWDNRGLSLELRTNPEPAYIEIVYHYFNEDICQAFFGERWNADISKLRPVSKVVYTAAEDHIDRNLTYYDERLKNPGNIGWHYWPTENRKTTLIDLVNEPKPGKSVRIVLLSTAGFGKSAEMQQLAAHFSAPDKKLYPLKYSLGNYEAQDIETILNQWNENWRNIPESNLLLVLDGLDEITNQADLSFYKKMNSFLEIHSTVQVVISSRSNFYDLRHSPLKDFSVQLLDPLNRVDIQNYLRKQLASDNGAFHDLIYEKGFSEYQENPYYLTRFVRFFKDKEQQFPRNKTELFERILFDRMDKDESTFNAPGLRERLYEVCSRIAFCMTIAGKSLLTDAELQLLVEDHDTRSLLLKFAMLNRNIGKTITWSFEHKNMQEYLCANSLRRFSFSQLHSIISLKDEPNKLLPRFLNTISFLFELVDNDEAIFHDLFEWLSVNEPEMLIRFEKEQMAKSKRREIFMRIFNAYEEKGLSLYSSANFSLHELVAFTGVDEEVVDFLAGKMKPILLKGLLFDAFNIISLCERPFTIRDKITRILFAVLESDDYIAEIKASCIRAFYHLGFTDRQTFDRIFTFAFTQQHRDIRSATLTLLDNTNFQEDFSDYIFANFRIEVAASDERHSREVTKKMVLKFISSGNVKRLIRFCILHPQTISAHHSYRSLQFTLQETKEVLEKAALMYQTDPGIVSLIYKLYCKLEYISHHKEWNDIFIAFFDATCGRECIFKTFYKYGRRYEMLSLAQARTCDFLIDEFKIGNISVQEAIGIRNILSHINYPLFLYFYDQLKKLPQAGEFTVDEDNTDYNSIRILQESKNQEMLLDKSLFLDEAAAVFTSTEKDRITNRDLWFSEAKALRRLQWSIALESVRDVCRGDEDKEISQQEYFDKINEEGFWDEFVIDSIKELLEKENPKVFVRSELMQLITEWTITHIKKLDIDKHVIIEHPEGSYSYFGHTEFIKRCVILVKPRLSDDLLLKLLKADYSSFYSLENPSEEDKKHQPLAGFVIERVEDRERLKTEVIGNIKNALTPFRVRSTHFRICQLLDYRECLSDLYGAITEDKRLEGFDRIKLAEIYIVLGGGWKDFSRYLEIPDSPSFEKSFVDWHWHLLEKLLYLETTKVTDILLEVLEKDTVDSNRLKASEMLIKLSRIEGLRYWLLHIKTKKDMLFESRWETFNDHIRKMPFVDTVDIFIEALDLLYMDASSSAADRAWRMDDSIFGSLINLAVQGGVQFSYIDGKVRGLLEKTTGENQRYTIKHFIERIRHNYYQSINQQIDLMQAKKLYDSYLVSGSIS